MDERELATKAVEAIVVDIRGRSCIGDAWNEIDGGIKLEIKAQWFDAVLSAIREAKDGRP